MGCLAQEVSGALEGRRFGSKPNAIAGGIGAPIVTPRMLSMKM